MTNNLGAPIYQDGLEFLTAVTKMLNKAELPEVLGGWFIKVQLVDKSGSAFGEWSDEIASDAWSYIPYNNPNNLGEQSNAR